MPARSGIGWSAPAIEHVERLRRRASRAWAARPDLPVESLPNYEKLVHPDWLRELIDGGAPEAVRGRPVPALPRELRRARGVRGGSPPRCRLPGHELARGPGRLEPALGRPRSRRPCSGSGITARHDGGALRSRHRGQRQREVAGSPGGTDRGDPGGAHPALRRRRRRPPARRGLRPVGHAGHPLETVARASRHRSRPSARRSRSGPS